MNKIAAPKDVNQYPMPFTRLEVVVLGLVDDQFQVLLAKRAGEPFKGRWALPGGVLRIDLDATLDAGAARVASERLGLGLPFLRQLGAVGGRDRDPERAPWALSVVYRALVQTAEFEPATGKRVEALAWRPVDEAIADRKLAFDHAALIAQAVAVTREEVDRLDLPLTAFPAHFTLGELQAWCEQILGRGLDKSSFRRRLANGDVVAAVEGEMKGGAFRPAQVFRAGHAHQACAARALSA